MSGDFKTNVKNAFEKQKTETWWWVRRRKFFFFHLSRAVSWSKFAIVIYQTAFCLLRFMAAFETWSRGSGLCRCDGAGRLVVLLERFFKVFIAIFRFRTILGVMETQLLSSNAWSVSSFCISDNWEALALHFSNSLAFKNQTLVTFRTSQIIVFTASWCPVGNLLFSCVCHWCSAGKNYWSNLAPGMS